MLEIWLKVYHFLTQISAFRENINYIHNNILLPWSSVCGLGGLVRARKESSSYSLIVRVRVVLKRTVAGD